MGSWKIEDIVKAVDGELINPSQKAVKVTSVYHNSKIVQPGGLFVPLVAERNGHTFIEDAINNGAVASFWSDSVEDAPKDLPLIVVNDTQEALQTFAKWYLHEVNPKVVGITGSNGKTTTKDMTASVLEMKFNTHKTQGNYNNELGVPLTILEMPATTEVLVCEMGTSYPGEIEALSKIAEPDVAVVTMIGESHIENFGSRAKIAEEKVSITAGLKKDGLFIYPQAESLIVDNIDKALRTKTFGQNQEAEIFVTNTKGETERTQFSARLKESNEEITVTLPIPGEYNVSNALIALLVGLEFGISLKQAKQGLEHMTLTKNRLEWLDGKKNTHILNDAYNASPTSMKAAINYFSAIDPDKDKILVLGDILELGELSQSLHEGIASIIDVNKFKAIFLYGDEMKVLYQKLIEQEDHNNTYHFTGEKDELIKAIENELSSGDLILFKSSNGTDLLTVVDFFKKEEKL